MSKMEGLLRAAVSLSGSIHKTQTQRSLVMVLSLNRKKAAEISDKNIYPLRVHAEELIFS